ncbi:hypothetical protein QJQ45_021306 [Haematococcus lacustris]|nr:hypothetical protein QJQ45_021306 [Haematococcus lacustris]
MRLVLPWTSAKTHVDTVQSEQLTVVAGSCNDHLQLPEMVLDKSATPDPLSSMRVTGATSQQGLSRAASTADAGAQANSGRRGCRFASMTAQQSLESNGYPLEHTPSSRGLPDIVYDDNPPASPPLVQQHQQPYSNGSGYSNGSRANSLANAPSLASRQQAQTKELALLPVVSPAQGQLMPRANNQTAVVSQEERWAAQRSKENRYRQLIVASRTGDNPLDRYKAITTCVNHVRRDMECCGLHPSHAKCNWAENEATSLLQKVMEVGEALCVLGTTDFGSRDNCTRAINSKDYAYLLTLYGEAFWALYKKDFIDGLSEHVQDEMLTMRGLLTTRFESNAVLQDQLIKAVGLEPQGGGGALVINTSVNTVHSKPSNTVHSNVSALAKAVQKSQNKLGAMALGTVAGLWMIKRTGLLGWVPGLGSSGRRSQGRGQTAYEDLDSDELMQGSRSGGRRRSRRSKLTDDDRLLLAYDHVDRCHKELNKALVNVELLKQDWRLGPIRLAAPFAGPLPPGWRDVDMQGCEPRLFMHSQLAQEPPQLAALK